MDCSDQTRAQLAEETDMMINYADSYFPHKNTWPGKYWGFANGTFKSG